MNAIEMVVRSVSAGLSALAEVAPEVAKLFTGGRPIEELTAEAIKRAREIPVRTGPGGTWSADLERRKAGGTNP